ncbi:hypothetical protein HYH02_005091 [Chlamydomonas schloesseri]|nr:hypothetical protein HYH02_005091 [Chlamydomonas schloesseri]|eukprot:KAG2449558.1 hypothetical protein HYH02_005091 [Chlamydomonas schloesseri]
MIRELSYLNATRRGIIEKAGENAGDYKPFRTAVKSAKKDAKGARLRKADVHAGTCNDTYTLAEYREMARLLAGGQVTMGKLRWRDLLKVSMTQLFVHLMHFGAGRGDDTRVMRLSYIGRPREVEVLSGGGARAFMLPITLYGAKHQKSDKPNYIALMRTKDVLCCAIRSLAESVFVRFVLYPEPFPDVGEADWDLRPLLRGLGTDVNEGLTYENMADWTKAVFAYLNIIIRKVTHAMRIGGSQALAMQGVPLNVIQRWGRWFEGLSILMAYLTNAPADGLLAMAGFGYHTGEQMKGKYWAPRFMATMPQPMLEELSVYLFPFLPQLRKQSAALPTTGKDRSISASSAVEVMTFLAQVAVQDSLEMADIVPSNPVVVRFANHPTWLHARNAYKDCLAKGVFSAARPVTMLDVMQQQQAQLMLYSARLEALPQLVVAQLAQVLGGGGGGASAALQCAAPLGQTSSSSLSAGAPFAQLQQLVGLGSHMAPQGIALGAYAQLQQHLGSGGSASGGWDHTGLQGTTPAPYVHQLSQQQLSGGGNSGCFPGFMGLQGAAQWTYAHQLQQQQQQLSGGSLPGFAGLHGGGISLPGVTGPQGAAPGPYAHQPPPQQLSGGGGGGCFPGFMGSQGAAPGPYTHQPPPQQLSGGGGGGCFPGFMGSQGAAPGPYTHQPPQQQLSGGGGGGFLGFMGSQGAAPGPYAHQPPLQQLSGGGSGGCAGSGGGSDCSVIGLHGMRLQDIAPPPLSPPALSPSSLLQPSASALLRPPHVPQPGGAPATVPHHPVRPPDTLLSPLSRSRAAFQAASAAMVAACEGRVGVLQEATAMPGAAVPGHAGAAPAKGAAGGKKRTTAAAAVEAAAAAVGKVKDAAQSGTAPAGGGSAEASGAKKELWVWRKDIAGLCVADGASPWLRPPATLCDLWSLWVKGWPGVAPPFADLFEHYGDSWYPSGDFRKRMHELKQLYHWCITKTVEVRGGSREAAAAFWTAKQEHYGRFTASGRTPELKPYWEKFVKPLSTKPDNFVAYVREQRPQDYVSPTKSMAEAERQASAGTRGVRGGVHGGVSGSGSGGGSSSEAGGAALAGGGGGGSSNAPSGGQPAVQLEKPSVTGQHLWMRKREGRVEGMPLKELNTLWAKLPAEERAYWIRRCADEKAAYKIAMASKQQE